MDDDALPRSGDLVTVSPDPIDVALLFDHVVRPDAGAVALFVGTVRDHSEGRAGVSALEYEAYPGVVEEQILVVVEEARSRWPLAAVAAVHRVGMLAVGEASVGVAVSAGHRHEAFEACRYVMDELKARAPIWKKEYWDGGEEWVG